MRTNKSEALDMCNLKRDAYMETACNFLIGVILIYVLYVHQNHRATVGDCALVLILSMSIINTVWSVSKDLLEFSENLGKVSHSLTLLTQASEVKEEEQAPSVHIDAGEIEFKGVTFGFGTHKPTFQNLNVKSLSGKRELW